MKKMVGEILFTLLPLFLLACCFIDNFRIKMAVVFQVMIFVLFYFRKEIAEMYEKEDC